MFQARHLRVAATDEETCVGAATDCCVHIIPFLKSNFTKTYNNTLFFFESEKD